MLPTTFVALTIVLLAAVPGASCAFAYSARVGAYSNSLPDRIMRFVAISVIFQALLSGPSFYVYREVIRSGRLARGDVSVWHVELVAICYVLIPYLVGWLVGEAVNRDLWSLRSLVKGGPEPRAWDFLFSRHNLGAVLRIKLKSGQYVAGVFGTSADNRRSYASGYPEEGDLYLSQTVEVDPETGEFSNLNADQQPNFLPGGMLVRWNEIEFLEVFE